MLPADPLDAIRHLATLARAKSPDFDEARAAFLKCFSQANAAIPSVVDLLAAQPQLEEPPRILAQLLNVDAARITANLGAGAIANGDGSIAAGAGGIAAGTVIQHAERVVIDGHGNARPHTSDPLEAYLGLVIKECRSLGMRNLGSGAQWDIDLGNVYIGLDTTEQIEISGGKKGRLNDEIERRPLTALEHLCGLTSKGGKATRPASRYTVILGQPGAGKTIFVNHLCLRIARREWDHLPGWPEEERNRIPVRLNLREFAPVLADKDPKGKPPKTLPTKLIDWLKKRLEADAAVHTIPIVENAFHQGHALLILDGLDEIADPALWGRARELAELTIDRFPGIRAIVTCRVHSYRSPAFVANHGVLDSRWSTVTLAGFSPKQISGFIDAWYRELGALGQIAEREVPVFVKSLSHALERRDLAAMAEEPLLLTMMATAHASGGKLPEGRAPLYDKLVRLLLCEWDENHQRENRLNELLHKKGFPLNRFLSVLGEVAFEVTKTGGNAEAPGDFSRAGIESVLRRHLGDQDEDHAWIGEVVNTLRSRAGLLREEVRDVFRVPHRTFQEYLAAWYLVTRPDFRDLCHQLLTQNEALWRKAFLLACGILRDSTYGDGSERVMGVISQICPRTRPQKAASPAFERLAGEAFLEISVREATRATINQEGNIVGRVLKRLTSQMTDAHLPLPDRSEAGRLLGLLGDTRPGVGLKDDLPDIEWHEIVAGDFLYGDPPKKRNIAKAFSIARVPVTVAQYQAFVDAGSYGEERWWAAGGFGQFTGPEDYSTIYQTPNHPRVGVSWYEAMAYCAWLTDRTPGRTITLPTEFQWERAARHTDGREYPWGDEDNNMGTLRCNFAVSRLNRTTPVGMFPEGRAKCGAFDFSGNVWEWCASHWSETDSDCVLRGGAFWELSDGVRCAWRGWYPPISRLNLVGFRVISSPIFS